MFAQSPQDQLVRVEFYKTVSQEKAEGMLKKEGYKYEWIEVPESVRSGTGPTYKVTLLSSDLSSFKEKMISNPLVYKITIDYQSDHNKNNAEYIAVFKKEVEEKEAIEFLNTYSCNYNKGMDSSKGILYFNKTGPKFMINFSSQRLADKFLKKAKKEEIIYEVYKPNWEISKY